MALAGDTAIIPPDEVIDAMGEVGAAMEDRYKETALGGIAATPTGQQIAKRVLIQGAEVVNEDGV
jgi:L-serine dehydratase